MGKLGGKFLACSWSMQAMVAARWVKCSSRAWLWRPAPTARHGIPLLSAACFAELCALRFQSSTRKDFSSTSRQERGGVDFHRGHRQSSGGRVGRGVGGGRARGARADRVEAKPAPLQQKREERGKVRQWIEEKDTLDDLIHVCLKAGKHFGISDISAATHKLAKLALAASGNVCVHTCTCRCTY